MKPRGKSGNPRLKHPGGAQANATKERLNILTFKTTVCTNESHHDWSRCKFYHNSKDRRRKLASGYYYPDDVQNDIEFVYHPSIAHTSFFDRRWLKQRHLFVATEMWTKQPKKSSGSDSDISITKDEDELSNQPWNLKRLYFLFVHLSTCSRLEEEYFSIS